MFNMKLSQAVFTVAVLICASSASQPHARGAVPGRRSLTVTPQNVAAIVGSTIVLECEVLEAPPISRVLWIEYISFIGGSSISDNEVILSHPNRDRYEIINTSPTMFHLQISNLQLSDGGRYMCLDSTSADPEVWRGEVQIVVIDGPANCTGTSPTNGVVVENNNHTIECVLNYQGLFPPTMYWTGPEPFIQGTFTTASSVWSGVQYTAHRSMDEGVFQCTTNFSAIGFVPEYAADNIPSYTHLFNAQPLTVFWGPKGTFADPIKANYEVGDTITCQTDARPDAYYMWQNLRTLDILADQPVFTVTEDLLGTNQTLRCQVQNIIHGFVYSDNIFIPVNVPSPVTTPTTPPTTPTTTPPADSPCSDFTGQWYSEEPYAELLLEMVQDSDIGEVRGIMKNGTDTVWVEVIGTARRTDWSYIGLTSIWPFSDGVTGMSGECHRCHGVEVIITDGMLRSVSESAQCGVASIPSLYPSYRFNRVGSLTAALQREPLSVWRPTKLSRQMGVQLK